MAEVDGDHYIPYEATAEAIASADESIEPFVLSLFPDAQPEQISMIRALIAAKVHEGIEYGLGMSTENPMYALEAHSTGFSQGYEQALEDLRKLT